MMFYTYAHIRNDSGKIFYVGKGKDQRAYYKYNRNLHWNRIVAKCGYRVQILSKFKTDEDAFSHEKLIISCLRDLGIKLVNLTDGGDGLVSPSEEVRKKLSLKNLGKKRSQETIEKMRIASTGKVASEETKKKISFALTGREIGIDQRKKLAAGRIGKKHSADFIALMSKVKVGKKLKQEHVEKISKALTGIKKSPEHLQKIADANRGKPSQRKGKKLSEETRIRMSIARRLVVAKNKANK
jgi:hypothetical protein